MVAQEPSHGSTRSWNVVHLVGGAMCALALACSPDPQRVTCGTIDHLTVTGQRWTGLTTDPNTTPPLTIHITGTFPAVGVYLSLLYSGTTGFGASYSTPIQSDTAVDFDIRYIPPGTYTAAFSGLGADFCQIENRDIGFTGVLTFL
jgi:hypothetical protein